MCENNKMLVATPLQPPMSDHGKPRVISEVKKATPRTPFEHTQPRISGELLHWDESEGVWRRKRVIVRGGALHVPGHVHVALRRLHLRPGDRARSFALYDTACDSRPIAVFQASNDREYDIWVKTIAIELMRQTPLDAIKYLDIMGLISPSNSEISIRPRRSSSSECSDSTLGSPTFSTGRRCNSEAQLDEPNNMKYNLYSSSDEDYNSNNWKVSIGSSCEDCRTARRTARRALFKDDDIYKYEDNSFGINVLSNGYKNKDECQMFGINEYQNVRAEMRHCDYNIKPEKLTNGSVDSVDGLIKNGVNLRNTKHNKRIEHRVVTKEILDQMDSIGTDLEEITAKKSAKTQGTCVQDNTRNNSLTENNINVYDFNSNVRIDEARQRVGRERLRRTDNSNLKDVNRNRTVDNKNGDSDGIGSTVKKNDFGTIGYSRVYNVRDGIQLKTYDLQLKSINAVFDKYSSQRKHDVECRKKLREEHESRRKEKEENLKNLSAKCETDILKNLSSKWSKDNNIVELKNSKNFLGNITTTNTDASTKKGHDRTESQQELKKYFTLTDYNNRHSTNKNKEPRSLSLNREREIIPLSVSACQPREIQTDNSVNDKYLDPVQSDERKVEVLLQRCQNSDSYVPVKDKLMLFESLCRLGRRLARSSEDLVSVPTNAVCKRARSMHDLSRCGTTGVREICKYFETKNEPEKLTIDTENKYNTIAKGYRMVSQTSQVMKNDNGRYIKKNGNENSRRHSIY